MNNRHYSSILLVFLLSLAFVSAALVNEPADGTPAAPTAHIGNSSNAFLGKSVSGELEYLTRKIFNYSAPLQIKNVIMLYALLIVFIGVFASLLSLIGSFRSPALRLISGAILSILVALTGFYAVLATVLISLAGRMGTSSESLGLGILFIALIVVGYFVSTSLLKASTSKRIDDAEKMGYELGKKNEDSAASVLLREVGRAIKD